ncbi:PTS sugar transporter subunit IIA [Pseudoclavibacter helvolus]|uniref:PTS sugar transporter subunit IIA n=1 Tax=Pseudoclavibacter helvolus TaxID=255205 RepID=UPI001FD46C93|nr:PTS glucose transporter subunit IIA [Pseudoclavibacter helvolus]
MKTSSRRPRSARASPHPARSRCSPPLEGEIVPLSEVPDAVFSQGIMGPGAAIKPSGSVVYAPGTGTVAVAQTTGHAFGLQLDNGLEILIHVGIDTVELDGKGFDVRVKVGDKVTPETVLVEFDRDIVEAAGFSLITPVIVLNAAAFASVEAVGLGSGKVGTPILEAVTKATAPSEV